MANANISQIKVGNTTYDIHDAKALPSNADDNYALVIKDQSNESNILKVGWNGKTIMSDESEPHLELNYNSIRLMHSNLEDLEEAYFQVNDLRDKNGNIVEKFHAASASLINPSFTVSYPITEVVSVTIDGTETTAYTVSENTVTLNGSPSSTALITITYSTSRYDLKEFTFGSRNSNYKIGAMSFSEGELNIASGDISHAEGINVKASGNYSHAEGYSSIASGETSHAEGYGCVASGSGSHAQNNHTTAGYMDQTVIGKYNDNNSDNAFEIGNGSYGDPSNAFAVKWDGTVNMAKPLPKESGGTGETDISRSAITLSNCTTSGQRCWHNGVACSITMIDVKLSSALGNGNSVAFGTVPSGYRPSEILYSIATSTNPTFCGRLVFRIDQGGQLSVTNRSGSSLPANTPFSLFVTYTI